ncbi:hypothetical protein J6590_077530 [Homalodisca vitripennis]|nr:hypothetical protein J6590_077530 [Homalodisca vitripennis]
MASRDRNDVFVNSDDFAAYVANVLDESGDEESDSEQDDMIHENNEMSDGTNDDSSDNESDDNPPARPCDFAWSVGPNTVSTMRFTGNHGINPIISRQLRENCTESDVFNHFCDETFWAQNHHCAFKESFGGILLKRYLQPPKPGPQENVKFVPHRGKEVKQCTNVKSVMFHFIWKHVLRCFTPKPTSKEDIAYDIFHIIEKWAVQKKKKPTTRSRAPDPVLMSVFGPSGLQTVIPYTDFPSLPGRNDAASLHRHQPVVPSSPLSLDPLPLTFSDMGTPDPNDQHSTLRILYDFFVHFGCDLVLTGDFNIEVHSSGNIASSWHNVLRSAGLYCTNFKPTRGKACIANIATSLDPSSYRITVLSMEIAEAYTKLNTVSVINRNSTNENRSIEYRLTSQTLLGDFSRTLSLIDWDSDLSSLESEAMKKRKTFKPKQKHRVMALLCRSRQSGQNADMEAYKAAKRTYRKALQVARRVSNEECINTVDNKCKATWTIVNCETGRDRPSHHVQPNAKDFNKYCISAVDEIRQNLSLLSSSAATQYPGPFPALQLASSDWW